VAIDFDQLAVFGARRVLNQGEVQDSEDRRERERHKQRHSAQRSGERGAAGSRAM
jgi:hypothetical protein